MYEIISNHWALIELIFIIASIISLIARFVIHHIMNKTSNEVAKAIADLEGYYFKRSFEDLSRKERIIVNISYFVMTIGALVLIVTAVVVALIDLH